MNSSDNSHWQSVYGKPTETLSWTRPHLDLSLTLLRRQGIHADSRLIDVGAGASTLVDDLIELGLTRITVLDLSAAALEQMRTRLGERGHSVEWLCGDLRHLPLPGQGFDFWHDRAVAHFLTTAEDEALYGHQVRHALAPGGIAVIAGFAPDGPERCSGLPVTRRDAAAMLHMLGESDFELLEETFEDHTTPAGRLQRFCYGVLRRR